ncbi:MAG: SCO family protein [Myxococcota bacterium]
MNGASKPLLGALIALGLTGLVFMMSGVVLRERRTVRTTYRLTDVKSGQPFTEGSLRGQPSALFFGFTACPDVCPTTLVTVGRWLDALGPAASRIRFYFVTVDPERDSAAVVAKYLSAFDPRIQGLVGPRTEIERISAAYNIVARKVPEGSSYRYEHTALVLLIDATGRLVDTVDFEEPEEKALAKLRRVIAPGTSTVTH